MSGGAKKAKHSAARHWRAHFARRAGPSPAGGEGEALRGAALARHFARRVELCPAGAREGEALRGAALARPFCAEGEGRSRAKCAGQRPEARRFFQPADLV